jgi:hypothetical protein
MPKGRNVKRFMERVGIAAILALAAGAALQAAEPGAKTGGSPAAPADDVPAVTPAEPMVLPNAPKVGDTAPTATTVTPPAPNGGDTAPAAPAVAPPAPNGGDSAPAMPAREAAPAQDPANPDWPCIQHKVPTLTSVQIWDGPPVDDLKGWENDERIAELTTYLESRRIPLEDAEKAIKEYAESLPAAERDEKLTGLFASVLKKINSDRRFVIGKVEEFQRRQVARAKQLEREGQKLAEMNQAIPIEGQVIAAQEAANLTPEQTQYHWNARIFAERQQNLTMACEIPVLIEQRVFEIGRLIRAQMSS